MATPTSETAWATSGPTGDAAVDALLGGTRYQSTSLTYSFAVSNATDLWSTRDSDYGLQDPSSPYASEPWSPYFDALTASDRSAVDAVMRAWQAVSGLKLTRIDTETPTSVGDLRLAYTYTTAMADAQAYAYLPGTGPVAGDVWFNALGSSHQVEWTPGSWEYMTAIHEIGHALGLKHPFETPAIDPSLDSRSYTVMSYSAQPGNENTYFSFEPTTPMVLDIAAIQHLYGRNTTANAADTTYTFSGTADYHRTLWDAGGTDTIVYQSTTGGEIDLRPGLAGGSRLGNPLAVQDVYGQTLYTTDDVWIARGCIIENATGGAGNDTLTGNGVANRLVGGAGNDSLLGGGGADTLSGGLGADTLVGAAGNDTYVVDAGTDRVVEAGTAAAEIDLVLASVNWTLGPNLEALTLTGSAAINATGNAGANTLLGNGAANRLSGGDADDRLVGAAGNDTLDGGAGNDSMAGGNGSDLYLVGSGADVVAESGTNAGDIDTILSTISWTLANPHGAGIERLVLTGGATNGIGNTLANILSGNAAANVLAGLAGDDSIAGGAGNDTLAGGPGADRLSLGAGNDLVVLDSRVGSDIVIDFVPGSDHVRVRMATLQVGNGDTVVDGATSRSAPGGFATSAELVVFSADAIDLTPVAAATTIGLATGDYAVGRTAVFVVDDGADSAVFLFTAADPDAVVSASELTLLATLTGAPATTTGDYWFGA